MIHTIHGLYRICPPHYNLILSDIPVGGFAELAGTRPGALFWIIYAPTFYDDWY